ncbi:unnamed protein product, partial [Owenia fusiformis]
KQNKMSARRSIDEDGDWNQSKIRGFDFDEENLENAKRLTFSMKGSLMEDDDDVIDWTGETISKPKPSNVQLDATKNVAGYAPKEEPIDEETSVEHSEALSEDSALKMGSEHLDFNTGKHDETNGSSSGYSSGIQGFTEPSIDDVVSSHKPSEVKPTSSHIAKLESEIKFLQRSLKSAKEDRWTVLKPTETVKRIICGQQYSLEMYKSKDDKVALLDAAIKLHDGNAITAAVLFLKKTIKPSMFNQILMMRPSAIEHYLNYLKKHYDFIELVDILGMLGRTEEAAMIKYKQAVSVQNEETKIKNLKACSRAHFQSDPSLNHDAQHIEEQIALLERQLPIEAADSHAEQSGQNRDFKEFPRKAKLSNQPVITSLYYCCFYHYELAENSLASPTAIRKAHRLTDKQFLWVALSALCRRRRWLSIDQLFATKGWFGGTKMKASIGFDKVIDVLSKNGALADVLTKYCKLIDDSEKRLNIASKYKCHEEAIDTLVQMKDRQGIEDYKRRLTPHTKEDMYALNALKSSTIKWKN